MSKFLICAAALFFSIAAFAACEKEIAQAQPYRGVIGTIGEVTEQRVTGETFDDMLYKFRYRYPHKFEGTSLTFFPIKSEKAVTQGDFLIWVPLKGVAEKYYPAIVDGECNITRIDDPISGKSIPGL